MHLPPPATASHPLVSPPAPLARSTAQTLFRTGHANSCPDCGQSQWFVGRINAECAYCEAVLPIAIGRYA